VLVAVFVPLAIVGVIVVLVVLFGRAREAGELSLQTLFRAYLYVASFVGVALFAFGAQALLNAGLAAAFGNDFVYGVVPADQRLQHDLQTDRQRADDVIRGVTFGAFGVLFWLVHWLARNRTGDHGTLQRAYLLLGTIVFGIAAGVLLPTGAYQALSAALVPSGPLAYRQGMGEAVSGGIVALVLWLLYLRIVLSDLPRNGRRWEFASRSAGAEAIPPDDAER
jgi:hypothetical protein